MPLRSNGAVNRRPDFSGGNLYHVARAVAFKASTQLCRMLFVTKDVFHLQMRQKSAVLTDFIAYQLLMIFTASLNVLVDTLAAVCEHFRS